MDEIKLITKPVIQHRLNDIGEKVTKRLSDLNIDKMVAADETVKSLKKLRAELNSEHNDYEQQRKFIKNGLLTPYNDFEAIYKVEISDKYSKADAMLKDKIAEVENRVKSNKKKVVENYFKELCIAETIDFITFDRTGIEINLSTSEKAYLDKCNEFIEKVKSDISLISTTEFQAEIMAEYKSNLNVSQSITSVKQRKEREKLEEARILQKQKDERITKLLSIGFSFDEFSNSYIYDNELYISVKSIENLSPNEFIKEYASLESAVKSKEKQNDIKETPKVSNDLFSQPNMQRPVEVKKDSNSDNNVRAIFEVFGTMQQLQALGKYMRENSITYKNIK